MAQDVEEVRRAIAEMHARLADGDHYEILGVDPEADSAVITAKYRELARTWHIDRYNAMDLGDDRGRVQEIFQALNNAHRTLSNDDARQKFDLERSGEEPTDVGTLLEADQYFRRGKTMLGMGKYRGAHEHFKMAAQGNPDDWQMEAHTLYTEFLLLPKGEDGKVVSGNERRAREIWEGLDNMSVEHNEVDWLMVFLGVVAMGRGKERQAIDLFQEALYLNSANRDAVRHLRMISMRQKRSKKKQGFFEKLKERFGGK